MKRGPANAELSAAGRSLSQLRRDYSGAGRRFQTRSSAKSSFGQRIALCLVRVGRGPTTAVGPREEKGKREIEASHFLSIYSRPNWIAIGRNGPAD